MKLKVPKNSNSPIVLIAEDKELNMIVSKQMVLQLYPEAKVVCAYNGQDAVNLTKRQKPDIILMDIKMPIMDGIEATKLIREYEDGSIRKMPIIALTAETEKEGVLNYIELGMNEIIAKPTKVEILKEKLKKFIPD